MTLSHPQRQRERLSARTGTAPGPSGGTPSPGTTSFGGRFVRLCRRLGPADREVLWLYLLTRVGIWTTAYCVRWLFADDRQNRAPASFFAPWQRWDWWHYLHIAQDGYFPGGSGPWISEWDNREAFFPGFPYLLRAVHTIVPSWPAAGALISFVAGGMAVLALARIARLHLPHGARHTCRRRTREVPDTRPRRTPGSAPPSSSCSPRARSSWPPATPKRSSSPWPCRPGWPPSASTGRSRPP